MFRGSEEELKEFLKYCNSLHEKIKFMTEDSTEKINFLDVIT